MFSIRILCDLLLILLRENMLEFFFVSMRVKIQNEWIKFGHYNQSSAKSWLNKKNAHKIWLMDCNVPRKSSLETVTRHTISAPLKCSFDVWFESLDRYNWQTRVWMKLFSSFWLITWSRFKAEQHLFIEAISSALWNS